MKQVSDTSTPIPDPRCRVIRVRMVPTPRPEYISVYYDVAKERERLRNLDWNLGRVETWTGA